MPQSQTWDPNSPNGPRRESPMLRAQNLDPQWFKSKITLWWVKLTRIICENNTMIKVYSYSRSTSQ